MGGGETLRGGGRTEWGGGEREGVAERGGGGVTLIYQTFYWTAGLCVYIYIYMPAIAVLTDSVTIPSPVVSRSR